VDGPLLLTVGSIFNRRRLPELLRAAAVLARRVPGVRLDVVGENRTQPPLDLDLAVRRLSLAGRVRFEGFVSEEELALRYAAADAAVFLSEYEGFGLPALEAMARGVPVVVSDRPSLSEIFAPAALVVDPRDVTAIAAALERALGDGPLRHALVRRARELAARHSWNETALLTRRILGEAAAAAGGA
jgi:glycosyltransferase involved in cell wall biosynthesis